MRYLGLSLGYALSLGFCTTFGTLIPPIYDGKLPELVASESGRVILAGTLSQRFDINETTHDAFHGLLAMNIRETASRL